jgi:hypothetical protein
MRLWSLLAHDPFDPLAADGLTLGPQFGVDARRSVSSLSDILSPSAADSPPHGGVYSVCVTRADRAFCDKLACNVNS